MFCVYGCLEYNFNMNRMLAAVPLLTDVLFHYFVLFFHLHCNFGYCANSLRLIYITVTLDDKVILLIAHLAYFELLTHAKE